jgi:hypothetical protein
MQTATRRRTTGAVAISLIAHLVVGVVVLLQRPTLVAREMEHGPPEAIIPILIAPRTPPVVAGGHLAPSTPIRLHRRPQPFLPPEAPTAPIAPPAPPTPATAAPAPARGPLVLHPSPLPEGPKGDTRTALRQGFVGCANEQAVGLNRAERDLCDEKFGKGAKTAAFAGLGLSADKQHLLDAAAARKDNDYRYKYAPSVAQPLGRSRLAGATAEQMASDLGNDKPSAKLPF